jgi:hypothetical protein
MLDGSSVNSVTAAISEIKSSKSKCNISGSIKNGMEKENKTILSDLAAKIPSH